MSGADTRGSIWRRWDPHIHAPGTVLNDRFHGENVWEDYLSRIENAYPIIEALGITDYLSLDLYEQVRASKAQGRLRSVELVFPNVELRLGIGTAKGSPVNAHLLVSPIDEEHVEKARRFLSSLTFEAYGEPFRCERSDLLRLGRRHDSSATTDSAALTAGTNQFKVGLDDLREQFRRSEWARENILFAVVAGSKDGTSGLQSEDASLATLRKEIERLAHIIFAAQSKQREFWLGLGAVSVQTLEEEWGGPKPCLHGSDAHHMEAVAAPDLNRLCWIKGDASFESLRQACIEPSRSLVASEPPPGPLSSQTIQSVLIERADWLATPEIQLNPGLVCIIGARGSGKTALADFVAAGGHALANRMSDQSFLRRAGGLLGDAEVRLSWGDGDSTSALLANADYAAPTQLPRVQFLSQQFVDQLCSSEGIADELLTEMERVVFEAHAAGERMGTSNFRDLLDLKAQRGRAQRSRGEQALTAAGRDLNRERAIRASLPRLEAGRAQKATAIAADKAARASLITRGGEERAQQLNVVTAALETVRSQLDQERRRLQALLNLIDTIKNIRVTELPNHLRQLQERHAAAKLEPDEWRTLSLDFRGDVDSTVASRRAEAEEAVSRLTGPSLGAATPHDDSNPPSQDSFLPNSKPLEQVSFNELQAERRRLEDLIGLDHQRAQRLSRLADKISEDELVLARLDEQIAQAKLSEARIEQIILSCRATYASVFEGIEEEQRQLQGMYAPLSGILQDAEGALGKLSL